MYIYIVFISLLILLLSGCANNALPIKDADKINSKERPQWINDVSKYYPHSSYLIATGIASDAERAKEIGLANLAKIFETAIKASSSIQSNINVKKQYQGDINTEESSKQHAVFNHVSTDTKQVIKGAYIADIWYDKLQHNHYALVVLERSKSSNILMEEMRKLSQKLASIMLDYKAQVSIMRKLAWLNQAVQINKQQIIINNQIAILSSQGRTLSLNWSTSSLETLQRHNLAKLHIKVSAKNTEEEQIIDKVNAILHQDGINTTPPYNYFMAVSFTPLSKLQQGRWYMQQASIRLVLSDVNKQATADIKYELKDSSAVSFEIAQRRLMQQLDNKLKRSLVFKLTGVK